MIVSTTFLVLVKLPSMRNEHLLKFILAICRHALWHGEDYALFEINPNKYKFYENQLQKQTEVARGTSIIYDDFLFRM